jgi:hypothetical protein
VIGAEHERARPAEGEGFADSVTIAFGDESAGAYGVARLGIVPGPAPRLSALAVVFADGKPVGAVAQGQIETAGEPVWDALEAAGVRMETAEPLTAWRAAFAGDGAGFDVSLSALTAPIKLPETAAAAQAGGMRGYDQLCRVEGTVTAGGRERRIEALGQRTHSWGTADWDRMETVRTVSVWLGDDRALGLSAIRPAGAGGHEAEAVSAWLLAETGAAELEEARLSTTYDAEGRQRRAGLECWEREDSDYPHRIAGEAVVGSTLELGRLRYDCAFFHWRMEGREGAGRYDILRRA